MPPIEPIPQGTAPAVTPPPAQEPPQTPALSQESTPEIASVQSDVMQYLFHEHQTRTILFILITLIIEGCVIYFATNASQPFSPVVFLLPLAIPIIVYLSAKRKAEQLFFGAIAAALGFTYTAMLSASTLSSKLLSEKSQRQVRNMFVGTFSGTPFRFCDYSYTINQGKYSETFRFSVFEVTLPKPIPEIIIRPKANGLFSRQEFSTFWLSVKELHLEGDFDKYFTASTTAGKEIEALQLLQPNTMAALIDSYRDWIIECTGTLLYCVQDGELPRDEATLHTLLAKAEALVNLLLPEAKNI